MANAYSVLGQSAPSATTATDVYTVPSATEAIVSTVVIANRDSSLGTFRLSVRPAGAAQANQHYLAYDTAVPANDSVALTLGITMEATDVLTVYCSSANMSVNVFGTEIS